MVSEYVVYLLENGETILHHHSHSLNYLIHQGIDKIVVEGSLMDVIRYLGEQAVRTTLSIL